MHSFSNFIIKWYTYIHFPQINTHIYTHRMKLPVCSYSLCQYCGTSFSTKHPHSIIGGLFPLTSALHVCTYKERVCTERKNIYIQMHAHAHTHPSFESFKIKYA